MRDLPEIPEADLIEKIEAFCLERNMTHTDFGRAALNDSGLMTTLRRGRELRRSTRNKILSFMEGR